MEMYVIESIESNRSNRSIREWNESIRRKISRQYFTVLYHCIPFCPCPCPSPCPWQRLYSYWIRLTWLDSCDGRGVGVVTWYCIGPQMNSICSVLFLRSSNERTTWSNESNAASRSDPNFLLERTILWLIYSVGWSSLRFEFHDLDKSSESSRGRLSYVFAFRSRLLVGVESSRVVIEKRCTI